MIKAIVFDFDGTISNRQGNGYKIASFYLRKYFKDLSDLEFEAVLQDYLLYECNGSLPCEVRTVPFYNKYKEYLPLNFIQEYCDYHMEHMGEFLVLKDEIKEVLDKLKPNYKLGLLTNGPSSLQRSKIENSNLKDYFDAIIVSGEESVKKPQKEIYELMANKLGVECNECIMVGDTFSTDILGAINSKMIPVWILEDTERPSKYYDGYRIEKLNQLFDILELEK